MLDKFGDKLIFEQLTRIPCLKDNYAWLIRVSGQSILIDAPEASPILNTCSKLGIKLDALLNTHHHWDHVGANQALKNAFPSLTVYGPAGVDSVDIPIQSESGCLGLKTPIQVLKTPGHTLDHLCYYFSDLGAVFTGDLLFSLGCGRVFEGSHAQMFESLQKIKGLPSSTLICCGHEYTRQNLKFALAMNPKDSSLQEFQAILDTNDAAPTVPSRLANELILNPFLKAQQACEFKVLRIKKDRM